MGDGPSEALPEPDGAAVDYRAVLRPLERAASRTRGGVRRYGRKAYVLAKLARAGLSVPEGWLLGTRHYDAMIARLPRKHDLRTLIKLSGTRGGDERCARAYEDLLAEPLASEVIEAVQALWHDIAGQAPLGVVVRPSVAGGGAVDAAPRHLHARGGLTSGDAIVAAIRELWASSVLSSSVAAYAESDVKDVSLGVIVQRAVTVDTTVLLFHGPPRGAGEWQLGVVIDDGRPWRRRPLLAMPLSQGRGGAEPPAPLAHLCSSLGDDGYEQLHDITAEVDKQLGGTSVIELCVERSDRCRLYVLDAAADARGRAPGGGDERTAWSEIVLGVRDGQPATRLSQSVVHRAVIAASQPALLAVRSELRAEALVTRSRGRSYLNLSGVSQALCDVPLFSPEQVLAALGGVGGAALRDIGGLAAAHQGTRGRGLLKAPLVGTAALLEQLRFDDQVDELERRLVRDARALSEMDITLLPNDALATTLDDACALVERSSELWLRCGAASLSLVVAIGALVRRRLPDAGERIGLALCGGTSGLFGPSLALAVARVAQAFERDPAAVHILEDHATRSVSDLPDGPARGALGQMLASYGDVAPTAFELSRPRWREDARDLFDLVRLLLSRGVPPLPDVPPAHVVADRALATLEPNLGGGERRLLRALIDRVKAITRRRTSVDRLVFRSLSVLRAVALDVDRRLRRIDPAIPEGGAFHCSVERLCESFKSGRPELGRVIAMRLVERAMQAREPVPAASFVASHPCGAVPVTWASTLEGIGVGPGVVDGRVRLLGSAVPRSVAPDDVLVVAKLDVALSPLYPLAGAVISESGGAMSMGAEAVRELGVVAVASAESASLELRDGERVRVDGDKGIIQRLEP